LGQGEKGEGVVEIGGGEFLCFYPILLPPFLDYAKPDHSGDQAVTAHAARGLVYRAIPYEGTMTEWSLASRMKVGRVRELKWKRREEGKSRGSVGCEVARMWSGKMRGV
jgi:hypothetical protein